MTPFFQSRDRQAQLVKAALEWIGTPFHPHAALKGVGVDCVWLAAQLYIECGVLRRFDPPRYTMDGGQHSELSQVCEFLDGSPAFVRVLETPFDLQVGDLLCFRMGRVVHHVGVVLTERTFIHVRQHYSVDQSHLDDPTWRKRLAAVYRPVCVPDWKAVPALLRECAEFTSAIAHSASTH